MPNSNPKITNIPINAFGQGFTPIVLTIMASKVEITEDASFNGGALQGLVGYYVDTQPPQSNPPTRSPNVLQVWLPNTAGQRGRNYEPIELGGEEGRVQGGYGDYVGAAGTIILLLTTNSANPGGVLMEEWA